MLAHDTRAHTSRLAGNGLSKKLDYLEDSLETLVGAKGLFPKSHPQTPSVWAAESVKKITPFLIYSNVQGLYQQNITRKDFCSYAVSIARSITTNKLGKHWYIPRI